MSSLAHPAASPLATADPASAPAPPPRRSRRLPEVWTHRTPQRIYQGPLEQGPQEALTDLPPLATAAPGDSPDDGPVAVHRQSPLHVLWVLTRTEFRARYRAQALGILWSLLHPLVMMGIIGVIFTQVFRSAEKHFPIFLLIGLLVWQWFNAAIVAATGVFVTNADIIKRTIFARALLPVSIVLSFGINLCFESVVLLIFIPIFPGAFCLSWALLLVPVFLFIAFVVIASISLMTSVLNVIYRDVSYLVNTGMLILYWLTPLVYPLDVIPEPYRMILQANPMAGVLTALRRAIMHGETPSALGWAGMLLPAALTMLLGWRIFRHYEHMVLDYV